jgi:16S rRNA (adenine1518-N6/adenine1519-N6)-dimethyltransferase
MSFKPNKNLGQHWLRDHDVLESMCHFANLGTNDVVFEIGPGLGTLTKHLAAHAGQVIALEFDALLAQSLQRNPPAKNVTILHGDILTFDLTDLPKNYKVVANLPYYITSKIVRLLLESSSPPQLATLLVQKEVAQRMAAKPGEMSILAVAVQFYCEVSLGAVVPPALFTPPPEVDSQIITLTKRNNPLFADVDTKQYFKIVRAGFSEKRKKLRNSLSGGLQLPLQTTEQLLEQAGISADARAQQLSLNDWYRLYKEQHD